MILTELKILKHFLFLFFLCTTLVEGLNAQKLLFQCNLEKNNISYLEPIQIKVNLSNPTDTIIESFPIVNDQYQPILQIRKNEREDWKDVIDSEQVPRHHYNDNTLSKLYPSKSVSDYITYGPGQTSQTILKYFPLEKWASEDETKLILKDTSFYEIRLRLCYGFLTNSSNCIYSNIDTIHINPYQGLDLILLDTLTKYKNPSFIYAPYFYFIPSKEFDYGGNNFLDKGLEWIEQFATQSSSLLSAIKFFTAVSLYESSDNYIDKDIKANNLLKAKAIFLDILNRDDIRRRSWVEEEIIDYIIKINAFLGLQFFDGIENY